MKKILFLLAACFVFVACGMKSKTEGTVLPVEKETAVRPDGVEVLCFHSKQRCATCIAIEKNARTAIDSAFADRLADGTLSFRIIDISKPENEAIAEKYQVTWSSLYIVSHKNGQEKAENMTEFAFSNARKSPGEFKKGLVDKINEMIN